MSDLEGFGERRRGSRESTRKPAAQRPDTQTAGPRPRRKLDLDAAPAGYDADVWDVARFFEELAEERGFQLAAGRPVLYAKILDRIEKSGIKTVTDYAGTPLKWIPMIKVMIIDFWDDEVWLASVAHAIDQFCGVETFDMLQRQILTQRALKLSREHAKPQPHGGRTEAQQARIDARVAARQAEEAAAGLAYATRQARPHRSRDEIVQELKRAFGERTRA